MEMMLDIIGGLFLIAGACFLLVCGLGLIRMPDLFTRIQAGTKATTLGTLLTLAGAACLQPEWGLKLLLIAVFTFFTNPLSSHVLARATHRVTHRSDTKKSSVMEVDRLAEDFGEKP
uniref:Multicomponent Na+:H+ antiporter subunit G n=1 Tax=Candidatus Kentrum sp. SD TaxID=2126332 RepID=A0A450YKN8_9GAMM|nr:MAG: multicomponent Na+:H+ antiporter subunit G [Candidatus Kentron sp. SD]VFK42111.1 MAG: multicomponent Na+:H+ antiporter subunit G [Candidatus Kentron sp. SD]VFK78945.1 MAG: multicomponent Na+:H+ antiporter subunit G [Candidatus Kentron sp. SD]